jgi:hypothetical protein
VNHEIPGPKPNRKKASYLGTLSPNPWDLPPSRQNGCSVWGGWRGPATLACVTAFRPLGRRSGRIPALPYPPPR